MIVHIQNSKLCALGKIHLNHWDGIEGIRRSGGAGWSGAELKGLEFEIIEDSTGVKFIYKKVESVID